MSESYIFNGFCPDAKALDKYGCTVIYSNETYKDISALKVQLRHSFSDAVVDAVVEKFIAKKTIPLVVFSAMMDTLLAAKPPKITKSKASKTAQSSKGTSKSTSKSTSKGTKAAKSTSKSETTKTTSKSTSKTTFKSKSKSKASKTSKTSKSDTMK